MWQEPGIAVYPWLADALCFSLLLCLQSPDHLLCPFAIDTETDQAAIAGVNCPISCVLVACNTHGVCSHPHVARMGRVGRTYPTLLLLLAVAPAIGGHVAVEWTIFTLPLLHLHAMLTTTAFCLSLLRFLLCGKPLEHLL